MGEVRLFKLGVQINIDGTTARNIRWIDYCPQRGCV